MRTRTALGVLAAGAATLMAIAAVTASAQAASAGSLDAAFGTGGLVTAPAGSLTAVAWGDNSAGELGDDSLAHSDVPVAVHGLAGVRSVSAGGRHDLALLANGTVVAWGDDTFGELGNGTASSDGDSEHPVAVQGLSGVVAVAAGESHSLALLGNGTVMSWGDNRDGQLGTGSTRRSAVPVVVKGLSGVTAIAAGGEFSLALMSNGTVVSWGTNNNDQLGDGNNAASSDVPVPVTGVTGATAIAAGALGALALLKDGTVMAWGFDAQPALVASLTGVSAVAAGFNFLLALERGTVRTWSTGTTPVKVPGVAGATAIAAGARFALALVSGGMVRAWGDDNFGQLGNGTAAAGTGPGTVTVTGLTGATAIAAGGVHAIALTAGTSPPASARSGPFSGVWRQTANPGNLLEPDGLTVTFLNAVSAASNTDAWAVGFHSLASIQPLAEHWSGRAWQIAQIPLPTGATGGQLLGVDELGPANVWAVGNSSANGTEQPLIEHFNGSAWTVTATPATTKGVLDSLDAIAGAGPGDLWAVGSEDGVALAEHFNGTSWSRSALPALGGSDQAVILSAVSADSATDAWVAGQIEGGMAFNGRNLALHWNGHTWTSVPVPCVNDDQVLASASCRGNVNVINEMSAVAAVSPADVWAAGNQTDTPNAGGSNVPYLLHWTGTAWSLVKTPNPGGGPGASGDVGSQFRGITALSASDVWVAGQTLTSDASFLTLTEHFNGTSWSVAPSLDPGQDGDLPDDQFSAVASAPPHTLFAVGTLHIPDPGFCCEYGLAEHSASG